MILTIANFKEVCNIGWRQIVFNFVHNISDWYNNNLLQGNLSKYQAMSLGPRNCPKDLQIEINDTVVETRGIQSMKSIIDDNRYQSIPIDIN